MHKVVGQHPVGHFLAVLALALLASGCTASSPGGPSGAAGRTSITGQTVEFADADLVVDKVVPAGASIDVPISFEGSSFGSIQVVSSALVTATFGGTALDGTATATYTAISTSVSNPSDGPVHVVNQGTTDATVTVIANVGTTRHLTVTPPLNDSTIGGTVKFDALVSEATDADGASAYLQDPSGAKTPIDLTKVGAGHWTGHVNPTVVGISQIHVQTSGTRVRYGSAYVSVPTGNVTLGSGFTEQLLDTDKDGLANQLEITVPATAANPGTYLMVADLVDANGTEVSSGSSGEVTLVVGAQIMSIAFDGASIYKSGRSGPYRLVNVSVSHDSTELVIDAVAHDLGPTQAYGYRTFQH
jgi:hypothetical protein